MNEGINKSSNLEELKRLKEQQDKDDAEWEAAHFAIHPEQLIPPKIPSEAGPEIKNFEAMIAEFESKHSLEKLLAIVELSPGLATVLEFARDLSRTPEELEQSLVQITKFEPVYATNQRKKIVTARAIVLSAEDKEKLELIIAAREDLKRIVEELNKLKGYPEYEELKAKYKQLSRAVGMRSGNKIDHDR